MALADLQLARRAHHAVRLDAANGGDLQRHVEAGDIGPRRAEHADQPGAGIGRAAHDLHRAVTGIDRQDLQLIRLRMPLGRQDARDAERLKRLTRIMHALDLQADTGQPLDDGVEVGIGVQMALQPA